MQFGIPGGFFFPGVDFFRNLVAFGFDFVSLFVQV